MKVDLHTLRDLEVISGPNGGLSLIDWLDRTSTAGGQKAHARRLSRPCSSVEEIEAVQEALIFLSSNAQLFAMLPPEAEIALVVRYLDSNITTLRHARGPVAWVESGWVRFRYTRHYDAAKSGVRAVRMLLGKVQNLSHQFDDGPLLLEELGGRIRELTEGISSALTSPNHRDRSWYSVLTADRIAREDAKVAVKEILEVLFELDALMSMAKATAELGFTLPTFEQDDSLLEFKGLRHPFVDDPVENPLNTNRDARVMFLTGPNMAGKTTYLKACGIAVLLAHCGMGVPARAVRMSFMSGLITAIRTEDSIWEGVSYFQAEARRVRAILDALASAPASLVIVDELFRGTNVKDACDATEAVLRGFARAEKGCFLIASHLTEVGIAVQGLDGVVLTQFDTRVDAGEVQFTYRVRPGLSEQRLGMEVLRREGVLQALERVGLTEGNGESDGGAHVG